MQNDITAAQALSRATGRGRAMFAVAGLLAGTSITAESAAVGPSRGSASRLRTIGVWVH